MPHYLLKGNYVGEGITGLQQEGASSRIEAINTIVGSLGGSVEAVYYAFGEHDVYGFIELPTDAAAAAFSMTVNGSGKVAVETVRLLTVEEIDEAATMTPNYRPPGD